MKKKLVRRVRQSVVAGLVGMACIFGCGNLEVTLAETATRTDATAGDAEPEPAGISDIIEATNTDADDHLQQTQPADDLVLENESRSASPQVSTKKYEGEYHIDYILSHYSYFVQKDLEGDYVADTVGAVMVGNRLNLKNTVGKVKAAASYAKYLIDLADYHAGSWNDTTGIDTNFYYTDCSLPSYKDWLKNRMVPVGDDYINMDDAFSIIRQESVALEQTGASGYMEHGDLVIDFANSKSMTVSGDDFAKAKRVILKNVTAEDIFSAAYTISVSGDSDYLLDTAKIEIGGVALNNNYFFNLAKNRPGGMQGGQYYSGGFGLVWNFPDAKNVTASFLTGHIIAPSGNVSLIGGNHEGQVIAQNVRSSSESHFYPTITTTQSTTTENTTTESTTTESTTTESMTTESTTTESTTTESTTTEAAATESTTTENTTIENATTDTTTSVMVTSVETLPDNQVKTGDTMALGIVITCLIGSVGFLLLFTVLREHKKK